MQRSVVVPRWSGGGGHASAHYGGARFNAPATAAGGVAGKNEKASPYDFNSLEAWFGKPTVGANDPDYPRAVGAEQNSLDGYTKGAKLVAPVVVILDGAIGEDWGVTVLPVRKEEYLIFAVHTVRADSSMLDPYADRGVPRTTHFREQIRTASMQQFAKLIEVQDQFWQTPRGQASMQMYFDTCQAGTKTTFEVMAERAVMQSEVHRSNLMAYLENAPTVNAWVTAMKKASSIFDTTHKNGNMIGVIEDLYTGFQQRNGAGEPNVFVTGPGTARYIQPADLKKGMQHFVARNYPVSDGERTVCALTRDAVVGGFNHFDMLGAMTRAPASHGTGWKEKYANIYVHDGDTDEIRMLRYNDALLRSGFFAGRDRNTDLFHISSIGRAVLGGSASALQYLRSVQAANTFADHVFANYQAGDVVPFFHALAERGCRAAVMFGRQAPNEPSRGVEVGGSIDDHVFEVAEDEKEEYERAAKAVESAYFGRSRGGKLGSDVRPFLHAAAYAIMKVRTMEEPQVDAERIQLTVNAYQVLNPPGGVAAAAPAPDERVIPFDTLSPVVVDYILKLVAIRHAAEEAAPRFADGRRDGAAIRAAQTATNNAVYGLAKSMAREEKWFTVSDLQEIRRMAQYDLSRNHKDLETFYHERRWKEDNTDTDLAVYVGLALFSTRVCGVAASTDDKSYDTVNNADDPALTYMDANELNKSSIGVIGSYYLNAIAGTVLCGAKATFKATRKAFRQGDSSRLTSDDSILYARTYRDLMARRVTDMKGAVGAAVTNASTLAAAAQASGSAADLVRATAAAERVAALTDYSVPAGKSPREYLFEILSRVGFEHGGFFQACRDAELPIPISLLALRPSQRFLVSDAIMAVKGSGTGGTFFKDDEMTIGKDMLHDNYSIKFRIRIGAVVFNPQNIDISRGVHVCGYKGGAGTRIWESCPESYREYKQGVYSSDTPDIIVVPVPLDWEPSSEILDISGSLDERFRQQDNLTRNYAHSKTSYPNARMFAELWGFRSSRSVMAGSVDAQNVYCHRSFQLSVGDSGRFDSKITNTGPLGSNVYAGCMAPRKELSGEPLRREPYLRHADVTGHNHG